MIPLYDNNPTERDPVVTRRLIFVNVAVFVIQWILGSQGQDFATTWGFVAQRASEDLYGELPNVFTNMFLHADLGHLGWNMLFLHIFGDNVEDILGRSRFLLFYLAAGVAGTVAQYLLDPTSEAVLIGASGAIAGVLGGYLVLHPRAPVILLNPVLPLWLLMGPLLSLPAWVVVGYWFFGNVLGGLITLGGAATNTAFFAHLGGFALGLVATRPLLAGHDFESGDPWSGWRAPPRRAPRRKIFWKNDDKPFWR